MSQTAKDSVSGTYDILQSESQKLSVTNFIWDTGTLAWIREIASVGGGGGGGPVTIANGADVAKGSTTDAAVYTDINATISARLRALALILVDVWDPINHSLGIAAPNIIRVSDAGGSLTVDGTFWQATQPVSLATNTPDVTDRAGRLVGVVSAANLDIALSTRLKPADTLAAVTTLGTITNVVHVDDNAGSLTVDNAGTFAVQAAGTKTNNNAAPGATNVGVINSVANEALPSYTEANLIIPASDLRGVLRSVGIPMAVLGAYKWQGISGGYTGLAANTPLWSMRWGDATRFAIILRVAVYVFTSTAATAASITERQLIIARAFTASDTGGTAATLTGNNQKMRTSQGTSLVTDMRIGAPITAGTRTLDGAPVSTAIGWSGLLSTGVVIGACSGSPVGAARSTEGAFAPVELLNALNGQDYPIILAQNEGVVVRIGAVQPTTSVQQTLVIVQWLEANKVH